MSKGSSSTAGHRFSLNRTAALGLIALAVAAWGVTFTRMNRASPQQRRVEAGRELAQAGRLTEAQSVWKEVLRADPNNAEACELLGAFSMGRQQYTDALEPLQRLARLKPDTPHIHARLAECLEHTGDRQAAVLEAREELKRNPDDIGALTVAANVLTDMQEEKQELETKRRLAQLEPADPEVLAMLARALVQNRFYDEALPIVEKLIRLNPGDPEGYGLRGEIRYYKATTPQALTESESDFKKTLELNPRTLLPKLFLGKIYTRRDQPDKAIASLRQAKQLMPYRGDVDFALAEAYDLIGEKAKAEAERNRFVALRQEYDLEKTMEKRLLVSPDNFDYLLHLGRINLRRRELAAARFYLERAHRLRPQDTAAAAAFQQLVSLMNANPSQAAGGP